MAVLIECLCHKKQSLKNKVCSTCGTNLDPLKKHNRLNYWIVYYLPNGYQKFEKITGENSTSLEYAKAADGKRRAQKKENRILDIKPDTKMTFNDLTDWYMKLEKVKALRYLPTLTICLDRFNETFGGMIVSQIKSADLENYQARRKREGKSDQTIDQEIGAGSTMINKAFDNDLIGGDTLKAFKRVRKLLKRNANARKMTLRCDRFKRLMLVEELLPHTKWILATGYWTGMRADEITSLVWTKVSLKDRKIRLEATDTKDKEVRVIPICNALYEVLSKIPQSIHDDHVFLYRGIDGKKEGTPVSVIRKNLAKACEKAGIPYGRFKVDGFIYHDLRHTFITDMRKAGVHDAVTNAITGHSDGTMRSRYDTVDFDDLMKGVRQLEGYRENVYQSVYQAGILEAEAK